MVLSTLEKLRIEQMLQTNYLPQHSKEMFNAQSSSSHFVLNG